MILFRCYVTKSHTISMSLNEQNVCSMATILSSPQSSKMMNIQMTLLLALLCMSSLISHSNSHNYHGQRASSYLVSASELYSSSAGQSLANQQHKNSNNNQFNDVNQLYGNHAQYNLHNNLNNEVPVKSPSHQQHHHNQQQQQHHHHQQFNICSLVPAHVSSQLRMCKNSQPNAIAAINNGALNGIKECQKQFQKERWNCSHPHGDHHLITGHSAHSVGNKESAFIHAITAAGIVHSIAKACSMGDISDCACDKTMDGRSLDKERNWVWGGCHENVRYGMLHAKHFAEAVEKMHTYLAQKSFMSTKTTSQHEQLAHHHHQQNHAHAAHKQQHLNDFSSATNSKATLHTKSTKDSILYALHGGQQPKQQHQSIKSSAQKSHYYSNESLPAVGGSAPHLAPVITATTSNTNHISTNLYQHAANTESNYITRAQREQQPSDNTNTVSADKRSQVLNELSAPVSAVTAPPARNAVKTSASFIVVSDKVIKRKRRSFEFAALSGATNRNEVPEREPATRPLSAVGSNRVNTIVGEQGTVRDSTIIPSSACSAGNNLVSWSGSGNVVLDEQQQQQLMRSLMEANSLKYHQDIRQAMNMHNNKAGRLAVARNMELKCRCHGVSGSCALTTCWRTLPTFSVVGDYLKRKYDSSIHIPSIQAHRLIAMMDKGEIINVLTRHQHQRQQQQHQQPEVASNNQQQSAASNQTVVAAVNSNKLNHMDNHFVNDEPNVVASGGDLPPATNNATTEHNLIINSNTTLILIDGHNCTTQIVSSMGPTARSHHYHNGKSSASYGKRSHASSAAHNSNSNNNYNYQQQNFQYLNKEDLIHLHKSPDYCQPDARLGIAGTQARECDPNAHPNAPDSCDKLCCGRGYKTRVISHSEMCHCKFHYCCHTTCFICKTEKQLHTCN